MKKQKETAKLDPNAGKSLTHNPFGSLAKKPLALSLPNRPVIVPIPIVKPPPAPPSKVRLRHESAGRSGKVVTRITGLPQGNLDAIASRLKQALGCGASVENCDVLLQGSLLERATQWLDKAGDLRAMTQERNAPVSPSPVTPAANKPAPIAPSNLSGMRRGGVRRGLRVAIVLKADQGTGKLTEGVVRDLLTSADYHPRGIKVRLESGDVGRVQVILG